MIIEEILSDKDKINMQMGVVERSNVTKSNLKKRRIIDSLCSVLGVIEIYRGFLKKDVSLIIVFGFGTIVCLFELFFARKIYLYRTRKSIKKQNRIRKAQYNNTGRSD